MLAGYVWPVLHPGQPEDGDSELTHLEWFRHKHKAASTGKTTNNIKMKSFSVHYSNNSTVHRSLHLSNL